MDCIVFDKWKYQSSRVLDLTTLYFGLYKSGCEFVLELIATQLLRPTVKTGEGSEIIPCTISAKTEVGLNSPSTSLYISRSWKREKRLTQLIPY
jgi:hypothetical protein